MHELQISTDFVSVLTEQEMAELVGGDGYFAHALGYGLGLFCAMIVETSQSAEMQQYCFGA